MRIKSMKVYNRVYIVKKDDAGNPVTEWEFQHIYIGLIDDLSLMGTRLSAILRGDFHTGSFPVAIDSVTDITEEFWKQYKADGRCTFDRAHSVYFLNASDRFTVINQTRRCNWCGTWHTQTIEKVVEVKRVAVWTAA